MLSRWKLSTKATVLAACCSLVAGLAQAHFALAARSTLGVSLAIGLPLAGCVTVSWLFTWYVTRVRTGSLITAYRRMAAGEWGTALPAAPDADLRAVRAAFRDMAGTLDELTKRLQHVDAQRRRFFADLAHELATPISSLLGIADALLERERFGADEQRRLVLHLAHEASRLVHLASDVRDLALLDDPDTRIERRPTDLGQLARAAGDRAQMQAGARLVVACRAEDAPCLADPQRIDQVFANLLANALRYTPDGGRVELAVARRGEQVQISVEDSGGGVPDELLSKLGERLFRVDAARDRKRGGHGLGLSIVAATVHRHGGTLRFERAQLGGLRVAIELPCQ